MKRKFTPNRLLRYIYNETSAIETLAIRNDLRSDRLMYEKYQEMVESYKAMPKATFSPSESTIQNILSYSALSAVEPQH